jgi:hypothetical protein
VGTTTDHNISDTVFLLSDRQKDYNSTAISDETNPKSIFESVAKQRFQKCSWFELECKAL